MDFVINLHNDLPEVLKDPELVDALDEFTSVSNIHPNDIITFNPDMYVSGVWQFETKQGSFEMYQAHQNFNTDLVPNWDPTKIQTQIVRI